MEIYINNVLSDMVDFTLDCLIVVICFAKREHLKPETSRQSWWVYFFLQPQIKCNYIFYVFSLTSWINDLLVHMRWNHDDYDLHRRFDWQCMKNIQNIILNFVMSMQWVSINFRQQTVDWIDNSVLKKLIRTMFFTLSCLQYSIGI